MIRFSALKDSIRFSLTDQITLRERKYSPSRKIDTNEVDILIHSSVADRALAAALLSLSLIAVPQFTRAQQNPVSEDTLQALVEENQQLLEGIKSLHDKVGLSAGRNAWVGYQNRIRSLEAELGDVRAKLGQAEIRMSENTALVARLRDQHAGQVALLQQRLLEASDTLDTSVSQAAASREDTEKEHLAAMAEQQNLLASKLQDLKLQQQENLALAEQIERTNGQLQQTQATLSASSVQSAQLTTQLGALKEQMVVANTQNQALQNTFEDEKGKNQELLSLVDSLRADLGSANIDVEALEGRVQKMADTNADSQSNLADLSAELSASSVNNNRLAIEIHRLNQHVLELEKSVQSAQESSDAITVELETLKSNSTQELNRLSALNSRLSEQLDEAEVSKEELSGSLLSANRERDGLVGALQEERAAARQHQVESQAISDSLSQQLADQKSSYGEALAQAMERQQVLTGYLDETRVIADQANARNQELRVKLKKMQIGAEKNAVLQQQMNGKRVDLEAQLKQRSAEFDKDKHRLNGELKQLLDSQSKLLRDSEELALTLEQQKLQTREHQQLLAEASSKGEQFRLQVKSFTDKQAATAKAATDLQKAIQQSLINVEIENANVSVRSDNTVAIRLPNEMLFYSGRARLSINGRELIAKVATSLDATVGERSIRVEGHTDSVPVGVEWQGVFPSNWELSVARSANAVNFLQRSTSIDPTRMSAAGYGEFRPVADNTTPEGRWANRRIEIVVLQD